MKQLIRLQRPTFTGFSPGMKSLLRWTLMTTIAASCLILALNSADSTLFKSPLLITGCVIASAILLYGALDTGLLVDLTVVHLSFLVWIVAAAASLLRASNIHLGLQGLALLVCAFVVVLVASLVASRQSSNQIALLFVALATAACVMAIAQETGVLPWMRLLSGTDRRAISTFGNEDYFAGFLILALPVVVGQFLIRRRSLLRRGLLFLLAALVLYWIVKSGSRSAWASAFLSMILFGFSLTESARKRWLIVAAAVGCVVLAFLLFPGIIERRIGQLMLTGGGSSFVRRLSFYDGAWKAFLSSPFIGNGIGNFIVFLPQFRSPHYWMSRSEDIVPHAHNEFLEVLSETGIVGLLCFLAILFFYFRSAFGGMRSAVGEDRYVHAGFLTAAAACLTDNLGSMDLRTIPVAVIFWTIVGLTFRPGTGESFQLKIQPFEAIRWLRYLPIAAAAVFIIWYIPVVANRYTADEDYLRGILLRAQNDPAGSTEYFTRAVGNNPSHADALFYLSANQIQANRFDEARRGIRSLLDQYPWYPKGRLLLALASFEQGDTASAREEIAEELKIEDSPQTMYYASVIANGPGRENEVLDRLSALISNAFESGIKDYVPEALQLAGTVSLNTERRATVEAMLTKVQQHYGEDAELLSDVAASYLLIGELQRARAVLDAAERLPVTDERLKEKMRRLSGEIDAKASAGGPG